MGDAVADVALVAGLGVVDTVYVHRDCFHRSSSIGSIDDARAFRPQVARWSVVNRRRASRQPRPRYLCQLGPANKILIRWIRAR